jgi:hypothetical protein
MKKGTLIFLACLLGWLVAIDLGLGELSRHAQARGGSLLSIGRYLEYGRSTEGKLKQILGPAGDREDAVVKAGWLDPTQWGHLPTQPDPGRELLMVYGQSFAVQIGQAMVKADPRYMLRNIGAPAAPLSYALKAYELDRERARGVVLVGVLASSLTRSCTRSGLALSFEGVAPYTFPCYRLSESGLIEVPPPFWTQREFRQSFVRQDARWQEMVTWLKANDPVISDLTFDANVLDHSALIRLARRAWVASRFDALKIGGHQTEMPEAFQQQVPVSLEMFRRMQTLARERGDKLVVALIHDQGYPEVLRTLFAVPLREMGVAVLDTTDVVSTRDPANFLKDGHFTPQANQKLAAKAFELTARRP